MQIAAEWQCHPAAVLILRFCFLQRVRSVSIHQSIVLHDKGARRILTPGSIVFRHQIVAQFCAVLELHQAVRLLERHLFDEVK